MRGFKTRKPQMTRLVGTARLGGDLHYNSIEATADHSHCVLEGDELQDRFVKHGHGAVRSPSTTTIELFFPQNGQYGDEPDIMLRADASSDGHPREIRRIELFDEVIYQDAFVNSWKARTSTSVAFSVEKIHNARLRIRFELL